MSYFKALHHLPYSCLQSEVKSVTYVKSVGELKLTKCKRLLVSQKVIFSLILKFPSTAVLVWIKKRLKVLVPVKSLILRY